MARKKPNSGKQRKEALQEKRAIKRGDIEKPPPSHAGGNRRRGRGGRAQAQLRARIHSDDPNVSVAAQNAAAKVESSRKLQSAFRKVSPEFLALWREKASNEPEPRPIDERKKYFDIGVVHQQGSDDLTTPKRPKWRYEMSKEEVERNEEGMYEKWRTETEEKIDRWRQREVNLPNSPPADADEYVKEEFEALRTKELTMRSPTFYEQNLEVWRQLWRVTELSSILLVLLDARCPPLHYPPSLHSYLSTLRPPRKIILVLTKIDMVGPDRVDRWKAWLKTQYPDAKIVGVESYRIQVGKGSRVKHLPHIPPQYLSELIDAMELSHQELQAPPDRIKDDPAKLAKWQPRVRKVVNWNVVRKGESVADNNSGPVFIKGDEKGFQEEEDGEGNEEQEMKEVVEPLTIGLIGQPNVGKSSLLNALFGTIKVKASRTPGKTKHFQTLFWSPELRLVDCPGLVLPNLVPMELQVLCAILPISQMASIASCISFVSNLIPLENLFSLRHPSEDEERVEDKRTWRAGQPRPVKEDPTQKWTAMDILTAYANAKGWLTAKAGRPDVNRAGNHILRLLADGRVLWAFEPPLSSDNVTLPSQEANDGRGIWITDVNGKDRPTSSGEVESEDEEDGSEDSLLEDEEDEGSGDEDQEGEDHEADEEDADASEKDHPSQGRALRIGGKFGALALEDDDSDSQA
ncbi:hypothetical protein M407DRAFT_3835 [Tulasnella calospora MUT 4182]|uniref:Guanine nucleotide-binding protein-like 1 n=1 Tax=Tulasnella calospora MUT 4182 TaxID=1051891 RepID=A0A0C3LIN8_9AGAM|nr:hypothetical protein M407DRAFT_3835 [Tulasnella calospora MUT 4182]